MSNNTEMNECVWCDKQYEEWNVERVNYNEQADGCCIECFKEEYGGNIVYQVRINGGDGGFIKFLDDKVDMECIDDCWRAINDYHYANGFLDKENTLTITITPDTSEEICDAINMPYEVKVLYTINR